MNTLLTPEHVRKATATLFRQFQPPIVTLYDQFGRPVYVPSTARKIGDTAEVPRPTRLVK